MRFLLLATIALLLAPLLVAAQQSERDQEAELALALDALPHEHVRGIAEAEPLLMNGTMRDWRKERQGRKLYVCASFVLRMRVSDGMRYAGWRGVQLDAQAVVHELDGIESMEEVQHHQVLDNAVVAWVLVTESGRDLGAGFLEPLPPLQEQEDLGLFGWVCALSIPLLLIGGLIKAARERPRVRSVDPDDDDTKILRRPLI